MRSAPDYLFARYLQQPHRAWCMRWPSCFRLIERVAPSPAPVLIRGESGTGKELVARAIHRAQPRAERAVRRDQLRGDSRASSSRASCSATRGAFTGATPAAAGAVRREASGGTLFLDEVGEMPLSMQAKLLRVLQEGEVRAVGCRTTCGESTCASSARIANVLPPARPHPAVPRGSLLPANACRQSSCRRCARDRVEDIPLLVERFFARARDRNLDRGVEAHRARRVVALLDALRWPGNVRELENMVERLTVFGGSELSPADVARFAPYVVGIVTALATSYRANARRTLREMKQRMVGGWVLARCDHDDESRATTRDQSVDAASAGIRQKA